MYTPNYNNAMMQNEPTETGEGGSIGSLIGIILIIVVIVFGGIYFWGKRASQSNSTASGTPIMSTSTNVSAIQNDLNSVNTSINSDLNSIDQSLQGQ